MAKILKFEKKAKVPEPPSTVEEAVKALSDLLTADELAAMAMAVEKETK